MFEARWSGQAKYQALLAVAQAANSQRDLSRVLEAVAGALEGLVPVDLIGVITHEPSRARIRAIYSAGDPRRPDESHEAYVRRLSKATVGTEDTFEHTPFVRDAVERETRALVLNDIGSDPRMRRTTLERVGAECAVVLPLRMGEEFVASIVFARTRTLLFPPKEALMSDR